MMWRSVATIGGWTMASRLLGFLRDILIAATLGAGPIADAFFVALKLPNLFRRLFGEGAFNAAFVPAFTHVVATEGRPAARRFASEIAGVMLVGLGALVILGEGTMPWLMRGFAPGFATTPARFALAVTLTRITFPYLLLICLAALLSGMLNAIDRFAVAAATPVLFNLVCIGALLGLRRFVPTAGHALALGVTAAGMLQLAWLALACRRVGMGLRATVPRLTGAVRTVLRRMGPGLIGAGVTQLNLTIGVIIASLLPSGTVSVLYYADRVTQLPLGTIGAAMGTALLPALSRDLQRGDIKAAVERLNRAAEIALALALPATVALMVLAHPIMQVLFGRGAFGPEAVASSASALCVYAIGLPAAVLSRLLAPACFARGDMATPVKTALGAVVCNLAFSLLLFQSLGPLAPAAATSIAALLNAFLLATLLWRSGDVHPDARLRAAFWRILAAGGLMGLVLTVCAARCHPLFALAGPRRWFILVAIMAVGLVVFACAGQALGGFDLRRWQHGVGHASGRFPRNR